MRIFDYLIVGSGPAAAMAAQTATGAGKDVTVIDAGIFNPDYTQTVPNKNYLDLRLNDNAQHEYMLGKQFEGISWGKIKVGSQLTPPRKFIAERVEELLPKISDSFFPMETLGYGGLGAAWGLGCYTFSEGELNKAGLGTEMNSAYKLISDRIGIAGEKDDADRFSLGPIQNPLTPPPLDDNQAGIYSRYLKNKPSFNNDGYFMGRTALALLTEDKDKRLKDSLFDMDFYHDNQRSGYRPWITIDSLKQKSNFTFIPGYLVTKFKEEDGIITITAININSKQEEIFQARKLILCAGTLGSARIVLRSLATQGTRTPLICNPYCYMPSLNLAFLGKVLNKQRTGFSQLVMFHDKYKNNIGAGMCSLFTYRSLLLFKLIKEAPLNFRDGKSIMNYLQSAFVIAGIHHPENSGPNKYLYLENDNTSVTNDKMVSKYELNEMEKTEVADRERGWKRALRKLNCLPIKQIYPGHGSSIHYAGTLPFSREEKNLHLAFDGRLHKTKNVYVGDSSGFLYLPAKGLTLTIMANAHITMKNAMKQ